MVFVWHIESAHTTVTGLNHVWLALKQAKKKRYELSIKKNLNIREHYQEYPLVLFEVSIKRTIH